jgi:hypothetical protein
MIFEIPTALTMNTTDFWVVTQCSLIHLPHTLHTLFPISHNTVTFSCKLIYFQVRYELIGRGKAQKYFQIDPDTGVIQVRDDLRKETAIEYEVHQ